MRLSARPLILAGMVYYAVMVLFYLGREVEGGGIGKAIRLAGVGYFLGMVIFYVEREVLSNVQVVGGEPSQDDTSSNERHATSR